MDTARVGVACVISSILSILLGGCDAPKPLAQRLVSITVDGQQLEDPVLRQKLELFLAQTPDLEIYVDTHTAEYERIRVGSEAPPIKELVATTSIVTRMRSVDDVSAIVYWRKGVAEQKQVLERNRAITESWRDAVARLQRYGLLSGVDPHITTVTLNGTDVTDQLLRQRLKLAFDGIPDENLVVSTELIPYQSLTLGEPDPTVDGVQAHTRIMTAARFVEDETVRRLWSKGVSKEEQQFERDRAVIDSWQNAARQLRAQPAQPVENAQSPTLNPALQEATGAGK